MMMEHLIGKLNLPYLIGIHDKELKIPTSYLESPATWFHLFIGPGQ